MHTRHRSQSKAKDKIIRTREKEAGEEERAGIKKLNTTNQTNPGAKLLAFWPRNKSKKKGGRMERENLERDLSSVLYLPR